MTVKNIFELPLHSEKMEGIDGLRRRVTVFTEDELQTPVRFINYSILPPGGAIDFHKHKNDNEFYFMLEGQGLYTSESESTEVKAGSLMVNEPFCSHSLKNTGDKDIKMLVIEVYNKEV